MNCEILVSVMNQKNEKDIIAQLAISNGDKCLVVNQNVDGIECDADIKNGNQRFLTYNEKGLSRSRNHALNNAVGDICIIADDDMYYVDNYKKIIIDAYDRHSNADIIAFIVDRENRIYKRKIYREGRLNILETMKLSSVQITFKREVILNKGIKFDERFGAGSKYPWGEENIFLFDCVQNGCKVYFVPIKIATLLDIKKTSWDKSNTPEHFKKQGAIYYRMSPMFWRILALQFVLRKRKIYSKDMSSCSVFRAIVDGAKKYKKEFRNG